MLTFLKSEFMCINIYNLKYIVQKVVCLCISMLYVNACIISSVFEGQVCWPSNSFLFILGFGDNVSICTWKSQMHPDQLASGFH